MKYCHIKESLAPRRNVIPSLKPAAWTTKVKEDNKCRLKEKKFI